jgi:hypothetical protein
MVHRVQQEQLVPKVKLVLKDLLVLRVHKAFREMLAPLDPQAHKDLLDQQVLLVLIAWLQDQQDQKVQQVQQDPKDLLVLRVQLVLRDQ